MHILDLGCLTCLHVDELFIDSKWNLVTFTTPAETPVYVTPWAIFKIKQRVRTRVRVC